MNEKLDARAHYDLGVDLVDNGKIDKAILEFNQAIELDPNDADAYYNRGVAHDNKREFEEAIADYTQAIQLDPSHAKAYSNRSFIGVQKMATTLKKL